MTFGRRAAMRSEAEILAVLEPYGDLEEFAVLMGTIVQLPRVPSEDVHAVIIEDDELASDCRRYLLEHGAPEFGEWSDLKAALEIRFATSR